MTFILALGSTAHAAVYLWNGSAGDGNWDTILNWTVTDSLWTWPNEEFGNKMVNNDTIAIDILNGDALSRDSELAIQGAADGSTTGVLTLNNGSSLTVTGRLAIGGDPIMRGQIDILGGSSVTVLGEGNDLKVVDDPDTWGTLNIVDSTVDIADDLDIDQGEGYINISGSSTVTVDDLIIANDATGVGYLDISGTVTINADDLKTDDGEGHITISDSPTLNLDDLFISDKPTGLGFLDVSGTATINIADDLGIEEGTGTVNIGGDSAVTVGDILYVAHDTGEGHLNISGNAVVDILDDLIIANTVGTTGYLHISGNPTITIADDFYMNDDGPDEGMPMVSSTSQVIMDGGTVDVADVSTFGDDNNGTAEFILNGGSWNSGGYINLGDNLDSTTHLTVNGGEMITGNRLRLGKDGGEDTGQVRIFMNGGLLQAEELVIKITDTKIIYNGGEFRIRQPFQPDPAGDPDNWWGLSEADMQNLIDIGTIEATGVYNITTDGDYTVLKAPAAVEIDIRIANGGDDAEQHLDDGDMDIGSTDLELAYEDAGNPATDEQVIGLRFVNVPIPQGTQVTGAYVEFEVDKVDKEGSEYPVNLIIEGELAPDAAPFEDVANNITDRTSLTTAKAKWSIPAWTEQNAKWQTPDISGIIQEIVNQDAWVSGNAIVLIFRDDKDDPSAGLREAEAQEGEADAAPLLHISAVIEIATQPYPADGAEGVPIGTSLSWSPAPGVASHDVYFGTSIPPAFIGNQEATTYYPGPLEPGTTYYWQIDEVKADGTTIIGDVWSFTTGFGNVIADIRIANGNDDIEERLREDRNGDLDMGSSDLEFPYEDFPAGDPQRVSMRFVDVGIPKGAEIISSYLEFEVDNLKGGESPVNVIIDGELTPDAEPFVDTAFNVSNRPSWTTEVVKWSVPNWTEQNVKWQTPDISVLVKEIVNQDGWAAGNAMVFTIQDDPDNPSTGVREAEAYEGEASAAPLLHITAISEVATQPNPANGAENVPIDTTFNWWPGFGAVSHDGYIGISSPPAFLGNTPEVSYDPGGLQPGTTYYWQINAVEADGTTHTGEIWSFTTMDPSLVAYYALENNTEDGSGNGLHGTVVGNPTYVEGLAGYGMAMEFDGESYVDCGNDAILDITGPISMAIWIRPGTDGSVETAPLCKADASAGWSWQLRYGWNTDKPTIMGFQFNATGGSVWIYVEQDLPIGEWYHIAASHDGATVKCYLDGAETDSAPMTDFAGGPSTLLIGSDGWRSDWIGAIDDVRIYDRALSEAEVLELASK